MIGQDLRAVANERIKHGIDIKIRYGQQGCGKSEKGAGINDG
jgi:hypothetical protein